MRVTRLPARGILVGSLAALLVACGSAGSPAPAKPASPASSTPAPSAAANAGPAAGAPAALQKVVLRLPWFMGGYDAPFALAQENGDYRQAGLDVSILEGKGSDITSETVGNGSDTFGLADVTSSALLISKGEPIKVVAVIVQKTVNSFVSREAIHTPKDLVGKTLISSAGAAPLQILPAVLARYGMNKGQLKINLTSPTAMAQAFARDKNSVFLGFSNNSDLPPLKLVPDAVITSFSDFGVNTYNVGIIASNTEIQHQPELVRRFVAASLQGWQAALKDPNAAVQATLKEFPHADQWEISEGLKRTFPLLHTDASQGHPLGWMAESDWKATIDLMHQYGGLENVKPLGDYYTNAFITEDKGNQ